jgi:hypothetical protein
MKTEEQSRSECTMLHVKGDHKDSPAQPRTLSWKQLQLAKFIAQEHVAQFEAIKNRRYKQVDEWKAEAGLRVATPPKLDPVIAKCLAMQQTRLEN